MVAAIKSLFARARASRSFLCAKAEVYAYCYTCRDFKPVGHSC